MKNKKAILLPEGLKLVIAVVCIILLIYLAYSLYQIFIHKSDLEKAKATLNAIVEKLNGLEENGKTEYLFISPLRWNIVSFNKESAVPKPKSCEDKSCLCICSLSSGYPYDSCDKKGACKTLEKDVLVNKLNNRIDRMLVLNLLNKKDSYEIWPKEDYERHILLENSLKSFLSEKIIFEEKETSMEQLMFIASNSQNSNKDGAKEEIEKKFNEKFKENTFMDVASTKEIASVYDPYAYPIRYLLTFFKASSSSTPADAPENSAVIKIEDENKNVLYVGVFELKIVVSG